MGRRLAIVLALSALPFAPLVSCFPEYDFKNSSIEGGAHDVSPEAPTDGGASDSNARPFDAAGTVTIEGGTYRITVEDQGGNVSVTDVGLSYDFAIDAYEVTVDRFDAWVKNGLPLPCDGGSCTLDPNYAGEMIWDPSWNMYATYNGYLGDTANCSFEADGAATYTMEGGANFPVTCVNWAQALAFCISENKRLPTETEWMIATLGRGDTPYPWGNTQPSDGGCNYSILQACPWPVGVGSAHLGDTPTGISDLSGSVQEWLWDYVPPSPYGYPPEAGTNYAGLPHPYDADASVYYGIGDTYAGTGFANALLDTAHTPGYRSTPSQGVDTLGFRCVHAL